MATSRAASRFPGISPSPRCGCSHRAGGRTRWARPPNSAEPGGRTRRRHSPRSLPERGVDDLLGLLLDHGQVLGALEGLGVDLVDVLRARGAGGEPGVGGGHLESADGGVVARRAHEAVDDRLPGQLGGGDVLRRQGRELGLLGLGGGGVDAGVGAGAEALDLLLVQLGAPRRADKPLPRAFRPAIAGSPP